MNLLDQTFKDTLKVNPAGALRMAEQMVAVSSRIGYNDGYLEGLFRIYDYYEKLENYVKEVECMKKALTAARARGLKLAEAQALSNLGILCHRNMDHDSAIAYANNALDIFKSVKDTLRMARAYINLSTDFMGSGNYEEATKCALIAAPMFRQKRDTTWFASVYCNLAIMYEQMNKCPECLYYADTAIMLFRSRGDSDKLIVPYSIYGNYYEAGGQFEKAIHYFEKDLSIARGMGNKRELAFAFVNLGICYNGLARYETAIRYYDSALVMARQANYRQLYYEVPRLLAELYEAKHDHANEAKYLKRAFAARDSVLNENKQKEIARMTARFDNKELAGKNALLEKDRDIQQIRLHQQRVLVYCGFGAALLLLVIGILVVRQNKLRADQRLRQVEQKQLLAQMNPHFIFNCLNSIQLFVAQNDTLNANRYLADFALLMRQTLENSKDSTITLRRELDYLDNYLSFEAMRFEDRFRYTLTCAEDIDPEIVEIPSMIVQPFAENAIRHGLYGLNGREGVLAISFYKKDNHLICEVDDNGIGIEEAERIREQRTIKHQSHGMNITRQRLELVSKVTSSDYKMIVVNKKDMDNKPAGTTIVIKFPLDL